MKKIIVSLLVLFLSSSIAAQRKQSGKVREFNSNKRPVSGVSIDFFGANITTSDENGNFVLVFKSDKKDGDPIPPKSIEKNGYEVVYKDRLDNLLFSSNGLLPTDIIIAKKGVIQKNENLLINKASTGIRKKQQRKRDSINSLFEQGKLSLAQLQKSRNVITEFYDLQILRARSRAAYFSRINKDDASKLEQKALSLFEEGKIKLADKLLDNYNYIKKIEEARKKKELEQKKIRQNVDLAITHASINIITNPKKAVDIIERMLKSSQNSLGALVKASEFYDQNHFYQMGIKCFVKVLSHPNAKQWQKANAHANLGRLQTKTGDLKKALQNYRRSNSYYKALYNIDSLTVYKSNLSLSYFYLGEANEELGHLKKARDHYLYFHRITNSLYLTDKNNMVFKNRLAISYRTLGDINNILGNLKKALHNYQKSNEIQKELYKDSPENKNFRNGMASSYSKLGNIHKKFGSLNKALIYYQHFYNLQKELCKDYPDNVVDKNSLGIAYHSLGDIHFEQMDFKKALLYYKEYNAIEKKIRDKYPENVEYISNLAISYSKLAEVFASLKQWQKSLTNSLEFFKLKKNLYEAFPYKVSSKNGYAISCQFLGSIYEKLGYADKALVYYNNYRKLELELHNDYPKNPEYKHHLAISYSFIGSLYRSLGNSNKALEYYKNFFTLEKELSDRFPKNLEYKKKLALSYAHLGWEYRSVGDQKQSFRNYFEYNKLCQTLFNEFPDNLKFKESLADSFQHLGYAYLQQDDFDNGFMSYKKFNQLQEKLYEEHPENIEFLLRLAGSNEVLALMWESKDLNKAKYHIKRSLNLFKKLLQISPDNPKYKNGHDFATSKLKKILEKM